MKDIRYIFFDLDGTLWDFEANSHITLKKLFEENAAHFGAGIDFDGFLKVYRVENIKLWKRYENGEIQTQELRRLRWENTLAVLGVEVGDWTWEMGRQYIYRCTRMTQLMPHAREILDYLQPKYELHMITNGWTEAQSVKMESSNIGHYFGTVITSDVAGCQKPDPRIFNFALEQAGADKAHSIYIGDNYEADIVGGDAAGWKVIFYNPGQKPNPEGLPEIQHLSELEKLF